MPEPSDPQNARRLMREPEPREGQPGLDALKEVVGRYASRAIPGPTDPKRDDLAGLNVAIGSVPDGLANGLLVGWIQGSGALATAVRAIVVYGFALAELDGAISAIRREERPQVVDMSVAEDVQTVRVELS